MAAFGISIMDVNSLFGQKAMLIFGNKRLKLTLAGTRKTTNYLQKMAGMLMSFGNAS